MVSINKLREAFDELGARPNEFVLEKCLEICLKYDIDDEEEFVEQWMAFSISNLGGADPTIETLCDMEIKECENKPKSSVKEKKDKVLTNDEPADLKIYNHDYIDDEDSVMASYVPITPKTKKSLIREKLHTPSNVKTNFSPATYSPLGTPSNKQSEKSGNIVYTFGSSRLVKNTIWSSTKKASTKISIKILGDQIEAYNDQRYTNDNYNDEQRPGDDVEKIDKKNLNCKFLTHNKGYMHDTIIERALILGEQIYDMGMEICINPDYNVEDSKEQLDVSESLENNISDKFQEIAQNNVDQAFYQKKVQCFGRIISKAPKMDKNSIELLGADETKIRHVKLDFSRVQNSVALFPGQTVVVKGNNINGQKFMVDEVASERVLQHFSTPMSIIEPLSIIVASSPFTTDDNLLFEPLTDLINFCKNNKPDVIILTGPFLHSKSALLKNMAQSFDDHFEKIVCSLMESIGRDTEVIIQSSNKDVNSTFVYPTHPYKLKSTFPNLHLIPDPCIVDINGLKIGVTSTDSIGHLIENEVTINPITDKVKRSIGYLFQQKLFYPLIPPHDNTPVDLELTDEFAKLTIIPNLLILPSSLKCFLRDVNKCLCINPGHLFESDGGTFARLVVHPPPQENSTLFEYVSCQVVKV